MFRLKKKHWLQACLTFVASNLPAVLQTDEYKSMMDACPNMVNEILNAVAEIGNQSVPRSSGTVAPRRGSNADEVARQHARRLRQRREIGDLQHLPAIMPPNHE